MVCLLLMLQNECPGVFSSAPAVWLILFDKDAGAGDEFGPSAAAR